MVLFVRDGNVLPEMSENLLGLFIFCSHFYSQFAQSSRTFLCFWSKFIYSYKSLKSKIPFRKFCSTTMAPSVTESSAVTFQSGSEL